MGTQITAVRKPARLEGADLARLAAKAPAKADTEVECRASQLGAKLHVERRWMFPTAKNGESLPSYQIVTAVSVAIENDADRLAVLEMVERSMTPPTERMVEAWLAELSQLVIVAGGRSDFADELRFNAYTKRLLEYPADVVRVALTERRWKFWPAWAELGDYLDSLAAPRRGILIAVQKAPNQAPPEPETERPDAAQRARVQAMVDDLAARAKMKG
jgi:hypothetical protein